MMMTARTGEIAWPQGAVRKLFSTDMPLFRDHLLRLDGETRRDRFSGAVHDEFLKVYAARCFREPGAVVFGYVEDGLVRGAAELHPVDLADESTAEAAFSVEPDFRQRGLGTVLFGRLIRTARNRGIHHLRINCLAHNAAMQALARKFNAQFKYDRWDIAGTIEPRNATPLSLLSEASDDARAYWRAAYDLQRRIWTPPQAA
jgi:RimJ/RimL family protein N-acetyltransferase